jgi:hypothetical protein
MGKFFRQLLVAVKSLFSPANVANNVIWYFVLLGASLVIPVLGGMILRLSTPEKIIFGIGVFLLLLAVAIAWRASHIRRPLSGQPELLPPQDQQPRPGRTGLLNRAGGRADVSRGRFGNKLDTAIDNQGEVDASHAEFGTDEDTGEKGTKNP